jgi:hypothetical protein
MTGSCAINTKETGSSETSVTVYKTTRHHTPHDNDHQPCLFLESYETRLVHGKWYVYLPFCFKW